MMKTKMVRKRPNNVDKNVSVLVPVRQNGWVDGWIK